jgi:uncharacterized protein (DUF488 family)
LLRAHEIQLVADVRRFPASRRHPHFSRERLHPFLDARGIRYEWLPALGGRRTPRKDSPHTGWREPGFRGYADYMETQEFSDAIEALLRSAAAARAAIMCAEALRWQCHRRLIADALVARGHEVRHILSPDQASLHKLLPPARLESGRLVYAAEQSDLRL